MKEQAVVVYRRKGKKTKRVKLNFFGELFCELSGVYHISDKKLELSIGDDIEFIKFQHIYFPYLSRIVGHEDGECILENCSMEEMCGFYLELEHGTFQIIDSKFKNDTAFRLDQVKKLIFSSDCNQKQYKVKQCFVNPLEEVEIYSNQSIREIDLFNAKKVSLVGDFLMSSLCRLDDIEQLTIGNEKCLTKIVSSRYTFSLDVGELNLNNCVIQNDGECIFFYFQKLIGKDFLIKSKGDIVINGVTITDKENSRSRENYYRVLRDKEGYITVTDKTLLRLNYISMLKAIRNVASDKEKEAVKENNKVVTELDLSRMNLISTLKGIHQKIEQSMWNEHQKYLQDFFMDYQPMLDEQAQIIIQKELEMEKLKQELADNEQIYDSLIQEVNSRMECHSSSFQKILVRKQVGKYLAKEES